MSDNSEDRTEQVWFRPRARLLETIGSNLIKDEMAGVIELVKNAHDADASLVTITFQNLTSASGGSIIINDDGHGMNREVLLEGWMSPASDWKARQATSVDRERPMLGRKGVGRFSAMRLGRHLEIETSPKGQAVLYQLTIDWNEFSVASRYIDEVGVNLTTMSTSEVSSGWTRLEIGGLQDRWDTNRLRRLLRELRVLLSPVQSRPDDPFQIYLDLSHSDLRPEEVRGIHGEIRPYDVPEELADYFVTADLTAEGRCTIKYERRLMVNVDSKDTVLDLEIDDVRDYFPDDELADEVPLPLPCGPLRIQLRIWDRDPEILRKKLESRAHYASLGLRGLRALLDEVSGVALYRDGFRVRPYGDPGKDWLGLGSRRVQEPTLRLGTNQVFGMINVSILTNPQLEDQSSREGLVENLAFHALRGSVMAVLSRIEPLRYQFRKRNGIGRPLAKSTEALAGERREAFGQLRSQLDAVVPDAQARKSVLQLLGRAESASETEHERLAEQAAAMHDMHALGILARFVLHEGRNMDSALDAALKNLERVMGRAEIRSEGVLIGTGDRPVFMTGVDAARQVEKRLDSLLDELDPLTRRRRGKRGKVRVTAVLQRVLSILRPSLDDAGVRVDVRCAEESILAWEADLMYALYNLLDNALYWAQQGDGPGQISVLVSARSAESTDSKSQVEIAVTDSGPGVSERSADSIFDLNYSEKPNGYGVGLFIARESAERSRGRLDLLNPGDPGAVFRLLFEAAPNA